MLNQGQQVYPVHFSQIAFQYQQILLRSNQSVFNELSNISAKTLLLMSVCLDLNNTNYQTGKLSLNNNSKRNFNKPNSFNSHNNNRPTTVVSTNDNWFVASFVDYASKSSYQNIEGKRFNLLDSVGPYISTKTTLDKMAKASSFMQLRSASEGAKSIVHLRKETKNHEEIHSSTRSADISNHSVADKLAPLARDNVEVEARDDNVNGFDLVVEVPNIKQAFDSNIAQSSVDADATKQAGGVGGALYHDGNLVKNPIIVLEVNANYDNLDKNEVTTTVAIDDQHHTNDQVEEIVARDIKIVEERSEAALPKKEVLPVSINYDISQESSENLAKPVIPPVDNIKKQQELSPMPGKVVNIYVHKGQTVAKGELLLVMEMMKMEHSIRASCDAIVTDIFVEQDDILPTGQVLFEFTEYDPI